MRGWLECDVMMDSTGKIGSSGAWRSHSGKEQDVTALLQMLTLMRLAETDKTLDANCVPTGAQRQTHAVAVQFSVIEVATEVHAPFGWWRKTSVVQRLREDMDAPDEEARSGAPRGGATKRKSLRRTLLSRLRGLHRRAPMAMACQEVQVFQRLGRRMSCRSDGGTLHEPVSVARAPGKAMIKSMIVWRGRLSIRTSPQRCSTCAVIPGRLTLAI